MIITQRYLLSFGEPSTNDCFLLNKNLLKSNLPPTRIFTMRIVFIINKSDAGIYNSGFYLFIEFIKQVITGMESVSYLKAADVVA